MSSRRGVSVIRLFGMIAVAAVIMFSHTTNLIAADGVGPCQAVVTKTVAVDDNCDGFADRDFQESVTQDEGQCLVYQICVENTATSEVDPPQGLLNVTVSDSNLGISLAPFGDIAPGAKVCHFVYACDIPAPICTANPKSCECEEVQGMNTAVVASAECAVTHNDACLETGSDCDDTANVACVGCSVDIQKTVALDSNCDGTAEGPFVDSVTQDEGQCVVYQICVANTGDQDLIDFDFGVKVDDATLGVVDLDFGILPVGSPAVCRIIPVDVPASNCATDPDSCECTEVAGTNTAEISTAICGDTLAKACDFAESHCDDTAEVQCRSDEGCLTRTPGYWGTHPEVTVEFLPITSCGTVIDAFDEAVQDMCVNAFDAKNNGVSVQELLLIRQCTAAMLNLSATGFFGGECESAIPGDISLLERIAFCCEELCTSGATRQEIGESGCVEDLDSFNNFSGLDDPLDLMDLCPNELIGTEAPCDADSAQCEEANGDGNINPRP